MFCPECGKKNDDGLSNCMFCGAELIDNQPKEKDLKEYANEFSEAMREKSVPIVKGYVSRFCTTAKEKGVPFLKKNIKILIPALALVVLIVAFLVVGSIVNSPEHVVDNYVDALKSGNWSAAYKFLDVDESDFINEEQFAAYMDKEAEFYSQIKNYSIYEYDDYYADYVDDSDRYSTFIKTYNVAYVSTGATYEDSFDISLIKQDSKAWLFYPSYKVSTQQMIGSCIIDTIPGATVCIDGTELTAVNDANDSESLASYNIDSIFVGYHILEISHPLCKDYKCDIYADQGNTSYLNVESLELLDDVKSEIAALSEGNVRTIFVGAIEGKSFDDLNLSCSSSALDDLKKDYENIASYVKNDDGTGLTHLDFTSFNDKSSQQYLSLDSQCLCKLEFNYNYTKTYSTSNDEIVEEASESSRNGYIDIYYTYEDGEWVVYSIDNWRLHF